METKSILIFGIGIVAGYLLTNYMKQIQPQTATDTPYSPPPPSPEMPPPQIDKRAYCEAKWGDKYANVMMMLDTPEKQEAFEKEKEAYIQNCMNPTGDVYMPTY